MCCFFYFSRIFIELIFKCSFGVAFWVFGCCFELGDV